MEHHPQDGVVDSRFESAPGPLKFERRRCDRWPCRGIATAYHVGGQRFGERHVLRLTDESCEGLGATTSRPLEPGAVVSVGYATLVHPARSGIVLRCRPCGDGYRVAIRFERAMAA